jgi:Protein of unknown function (DUF4058)
MPSPFPGMDPYLEDPGYFPDLHGTLIAFIKQELQGRLPEAYYAQSDQYVWLETTRHSVQPDVNVMRERGERRPKRRRAARGGVAVAEVETGLEASRPVIIAVETIEHDEHTERFVEIYERKSSRDRLVATIEVVSPANKTPSHPGFDKYREKQREVLAAQAHLIEIDLLRKGTHVTAVPRDIARAEAGPFDYHVSLHRFDRPNEYFVYPIRLEERLPVLTIPLLPGDPEVLLDLQAAFDRAYDAGPYRKRIRYGEDRIRPPLRPEQAEWAKSITKPS